MTYKPAMKVLTCPVKGCGYRCEWTGMYSHFQQVNETGDALSRGRHLALETAVERATTDAYIRAERDTVTRLCKAAE